MLPNHAASSCVPLLRLSRLLHLAELRLGHLLATTGTGTGTSSRILPTHQIFFCIAKTLFKQWSYGMVAPPVIDVLRRT